MLHKMFQVMEENAYNPGSNILLGHVPDLPAAEVRREDLPKGIYEIEVIGGNHTRAALQVLRSKHPEREEFSSWPVRVFAGLSDDQALKLGHEHNKAHEAARKTTFEEFCRLFRRKLTCTLGTPGVSAGLRRRTLTPWKKKLVALLDLEVGVSSISLHYVS